MNIDGPWKLSQGVHEGRPLIVRLNTGLRRVAGRPEYAFQVGVAVPLRNPKQDGLPTREESVQLELIEDALTTTLEQDHGCVLAAVLSTGGMREFVLYTVAPTTVESRVESLRAVTSTHELQLMIQPDPKWRVYRSLT
jgi:hypothetical protein